MITRLFHLHPSLKNFVLDIHGESDPNNVPPKHHDTDIVWFESPHVVRAGMHEATRFRLHAFGGYTMHAFSVDGIGNEVHWKQEGAGCSSPILVTPFYDAGTHSIEIVIIAIAIGPRLGGPDQLGIPPQVHTAKCPVRIIFTPRLED